MATAYSLDLKERVLKDCDVGIRARLWNVSVRLRGHCPVAPVLSALPALNVDSPTDDESAKWSETVPGKSRIVPHKTL